MKFYIKEARERVGISQKELAESLGIKPTTFNGYEKGTHDPKSDILVLIAKKCNTSVDFLLGCTDDPRPIKEIKAFAPQSGESNLQKKQLTQNYDTLNQDGKNRLVQYSDDLKGNPRYVEESYNDNNSNDIVSDQISTMQKTDKAFIVTPTKQK